MILFVEYLATMLQIVPKKMTLLKENKMISELDYFYDQKLWPMIWSYNRDVHWIHR